MTIEDLINYIDNKNIKKILVTGPSHSGSEDIGRMLSSSYGYLYFDREQFFNKESLPILEELFSKYDNIICHCPDILPNNLKVFTVITNRNVEDIEKDRNKQFYKSNLSAEKFYLSWSKSDFFPVSWEDYKNIRIPQIYGFYHVAFMNQWNIVVKKQINKLKTSGILDKTKKLYVGCVGEKSNIVILEKLLTGINYKLFHDSNLKKYEMFTLQNLYDLSRLEDFYCWYIHTKGVSIDKNKDILVWRQKQLWRCYMEEFVINQHHKCIDMLSYYDCVGVNKKEKPNLHFQGNFWWSKSSIIRTLGCLWVNHNRLNKNIRMNAEFWFDTNKDSKLYSLYNIDLSDDRIKNFADFE